MSARSDVFETMYMLLTKESREELEGILKIEDISAHTMRTFLNLMYKDALKNEDIDSNLLLAAEKYNGKRLIDVCLRRLLKNIV